MAEIISRVNQFLNVVMLQPQKIFENFGLSLAIPSDCSYNVCPQNSNCFRAFKAECLSQGSKISR